MKSFAFLLVVVAVLIQNAYTLVIRGGPCGCGCPATSGPLLSAPVCTTIAQPSVAGSLADTLSLLTVSSLLAESLPLNPNVVAAVPVPVPSLVCGGCGCGGCGCDGCGCDGCGYGVCGCGGCGWVGCGCGGCGCGGCGCGGYKGCYCIY